MSKANVLFTLYGVDLTIQCTTNDKMKDIINKFLVKIEKNDQNILYYLYNGSRINEELNLPVAHEICLEKTYNVDGSIDFSAKDIENTNISVSRLKELLNSSQVMNNDCGKTIVKADTIHFTNRISNSLELIKQARELVTPVPVNYKNAYASGWVE